MGTSEKRPDLAMGRRLIGISEDDTFWWSNGVLGGRRV